jgi:hypothetical protein
MGVFDRLKNKAEDLTKKAKPAAENLTEKAKPLAKNLGDRAEHLTETVKDRTTKVAGKFHQGAGHDEPASTDSPAAPPPARPGQAPQTAPDGAGGPTRPTGNAAGEPPPPAP